MARGMLKLLGLGAFSLAAAGCEQQQPAMPDARMREIAAANPGMTPACLERLGSGGVEAWPSRTEECFEMGPRQRFRGLYRGGFELSRFCPAPAPACPRDGSEGMIWLEFGEKSWPRRRPADGLYQVEFDGRQTRVKGAHGHLNDYAHVVVVDDLLSLTPLEAGTSDGMPAPRPGEP
jgi:hypothetical protein